MNSARIILPGGKNFRLVNKGGWMKNTGFFFLVLAVAAMVLCAGCSQQQQAQQTPVPTPVPTPQPTAIKIAGTIGTAGSPFGTILVDSRGRTLYYSADDIAAGEISTCNGECATLWPAISADTTKVSSPLIPADFGSVTRADGSEQTTYHGMPLYYYQQDVKAGNINGENVNNIWFVVRPGQRLLVAHTEKFGSFLTDGSGKTLYTSAKDTAGTSNCTDDCIARWPPFSADPVTAPSFLKPADFSTVTRADGKKQTAFLGKPLYSFAGDGRPGDVNGQGMEGTWSVANVTGGSPG
jgi:predicted lipoprotein with Yx(FWY)xxD motif